jgi:bacteriocin biosynthesis cyclodehydratase domain-containing protein
MASNLNHLVINPAVTWVRVSDDRLLLRLPDGEQVTFDRDAREIETVLQYLRTSEGRDSVPACSTLLYDDVVGFLRERGLLADAGVAGERDWFRHHLAFVSACATPGTGYRTQRCALRGAGWMRERAAMALRAAGLEVTPTDDCTDAATLVVVASDWDDHVLFRRENANAVRHGQRITFFGRAGIHLIAGPLVVPGQSACLECYFRRLSFNTRFPEEFEAYGAFCAARQARGERATSPLAAGLVEFVVARHVLGAVRELPVLVEPGVIDALDCATLRLTTQHVLKVPRCGVCGRRSAKPQRSIRDLA